MLIENTSLPDEYILNHIVSMSKKKSTTEDPSSRVFIFPTLQMNVVNYREDEDTLLRLLTDYSKNGQLKTLKLATGYFNLQQEFVDLITKNRNI